MLKPYWTLFQQTLAETLDPKPYTVETQDPVEPHKTHKTSITKNLASSTTGPQKVQTV